MGTSRADIVEKPPLRLILLVGLALRILAAFNSPGYLMHDDHFLVVEVGAGQLPLLVVFGLLKSVRRHQRG